MDELQMLETEAAAQQQAGLFRHHQQIQIAERGAIAEQHHHPRERHQRIKQRLQQTQRQWQSQSVNIAGLQSAFFRHPQQCVVLGLAGHEQPDFWAILPAQHFKGDRRAVRQLMQLIVVEQEATADATMFARGRPNQLCHQVLLDHRTHNLMPPDADLLNLSPHA